MTQICNRCLIHEGAQTSLICRWQDAAGLHYSDYCNNPVSPVFVHKWASGHLANPDAKDGTIQFEMNTYDNVVIAISTWQGDPVCALHLWWLATGTR